MQPLMAGTLAPDFSLKDQHDLPVSLAQLRGKKVLIYFYPKAMTPGCTTQACALRDSQAELAAHNVVILGISPDNVSRLQKFALRDNLNFPLLADEDHALAQAFGVWGTKKFMGKVYDGIHRQSFLIDEQGKIIQHFAKFKTSDHHQVVLNYLNQISAS